MRKKLPKYIAENFDATQADWDRWLAYIEETKEQFKTWDGAWDWFENNKNLIGTGVSIGLSGPSHSSKSKSVDFKWAYASRVSYEYGGTTIALVYDQDCDLVDIVSFSKD